MHKVFSKSLAISLALSLLSASVGVQAAYSTDSDCSAVSNSAKNSADAAKKKIDDASKAINNAIVSNKQCIDTITEGANRAIPNFGSGFLDQFINAAKKQLSTSACNQLSQAIAPVTNFTMPTAPSTYTTTIPNIQIPAMSQSQSTTSAQPAGADQPSILQRLANIF